MIFESNRRHLLGRARCTSDRACRQLGSGQARPTKGRTGWRVVGVSIGLLALVSVAHGQTPQSGKEGAPPRVGDAGFSLAAQRDRIEASIATIDEAFDSARRSGDLALSTCVEERDERAREVLALARVELTAAQADGATPQQRRLALRKLTAAADRLEELVNESSECTGTLMPSIDAGPEEGAQHVDVVPAVEDPTQQIAIAGVLPPATGMHWLIASPSI